MKKCLLILVVLISIMNVSYCASQPEISGKAGIVIDVASGRVLYAKNINAKLPMASTTKIMTAIVAIENGNLNDIIKTSPRAAHVEGSSIWLEENESITVENALYGLMLSSGNDVAVALAEKIAESESKFVQLMNSTAKRIGAKNTSFSNPHGLYDEGHYTTAYDLALITSYALKNKTFAQIVKTKNKVIPWEGHEWDRSLRNHNKLLWTYEYADGVKTGFTKKSGRCLVSSATKNNWQIVGVTLDAGDDWNDHKSMLEYSFNTYNPKMVVEKGQFMKTVSVKDGFQDAVSLVTESEFLYPMSENEQYDIEIKYNVPEFVKAPILQSQVIGNIEIFCNNTNVKTINLKPAQYVKERSTTNQFVNVVKNWFYLFNNSYNLMV